LIALTRPPLVRVVAERVDAEHGRARVEDAHHDLLAVQGRQGGYAEVDRLVLRQHELHAPVLRYALLGDVQARDHLDARGDLVLEHQRRLRDVAQDAVGAHADAVVLFVGLEVDVGGALVDRVDQHLLDELDDRGVIDLVRLVLVALLRRAVLLQHVHVEGFAGELLERVGGRFGQGVDDALELVGLGDHEVELHAGLEADLVERAQVRRVGGGERDAVLALGERGDLVLGEQLAVDRLAREHRGVEGGDVEQRIAEGLGGEARHRRAVHQAAIGHLEHEGVGAVARVRGAGEGVGLLQMTVLDQRPGNPLRVGLVVAAMPCSRSRCGRCCPPPAAL
jgi:hypothetical protein